jgi:hypothetical protein
MKKCIIKLVILLVFAFTGLSIDNYSVKAEEVNTLNFSNEETIKIIEELEKRQSNSNPTQDSTSAPQIRQLSIGVGAGALAWWVGETFWIPGVGEVVIATAGALVIAGVVVYVGDWLFDSVADHILSQKEKEYEEAKKNGIPTSKHTKVTGRQLKGSGKAPYSSEDL